jgi:hypothetical protein
MRHKLLYHEARHAVMAVTVGADIKVVDVVGDDRRAGFVQLKYPERTRTDVVHVGRRSRRSRP